MTLRQARGARKREIVEAPRILVYMNGGGSSPDLSNRMLGMGIPEHGYQWYMDYWLAPVRRWAGPNLKGVLFHNPYGQDNLPGMDFDAFDEANAAGLDYVKGFVPAALKVTRSGMPGYGYMGILERDAEMEATGAKGDLLRVDTYARKVIRNMAAITNAGLVPAFDAAVMEPYESAIHGLALFLKGRGITPLIEAVPTKFNPHWTHFPFVAGNQVVDNVSATDGWSVPLESYPHERITFRQSPPEGMTWENNLDWVIPDTRAYLAAGWSVSVPVLTLHAMMEKGMRFDALLN